MTKLLRSIAFAVALLFLYANPLFVSRVSAGTPHDFGVGGGRQIKHVFVIVLENEGYSTTFGPNPKAPYLSQTLTKEGVLLSQYYGTGHASLDNYIAMISGQAATPQTRNDCQIYADFVLTGVTSDGQAIGSGCIYPESIKSLPDQLNSVGKTWRAYMGDMGNDPARESVTCGHPPLNHSTRPTIPRPPKLLQPRCRWEINMRRGTIRSCIFIRSSIRLPATRTWSILIN